MSFYNLKEENQFEFDLEDFKTNLQSDVDFLILCNPNNPTSSVIKKGELELLIQECADRNIFVMIDETYVEFAPCVEEITAAPLVDKYNNFMILRGVSKFFAAPGLRLGYGITSNKEFLATLKRHQNPWSLNSLGALAGELMLTDTYYIKKTRELILSEREKMCQQLSSFKHAKYYEPYGNFILVKITKAGLTSQDVFEHCIRKGLMIRDCSTFDSLNGEYVRFCMMSPKDNKRLMESLKEILA
jgi:threonine-phosphate decarboxylase